jgi:hypothetical protein
LIKHDRGAAVRARLLNQAHAQKRPFQEFLQYYSMERFLYRLSGSRNAEQFVLKGALLLTAWRHRSRAPRWILISWGERATKIEIQPNEVQTI